MKILNLNEISSSPAEELQDRGDIDKYRPKHGEVSLQRYNGTNIYQWHYRTRVYWHPSGPKFFIEKNNKKFNSGACKRQPVEGYGDCMCGSEGCCQCNPW